MFLMPKLRRYCYGLTGNKDLGDDLLHNSVVKILEKFNLCIFMSATINRTILSKETGIAENEFDDLSKSPIINAMNEGKNIIATPHIGGMTTEGQTKAYKWSINKL